MGFLPLACMLKAGRSRPDRQGEQIPGPRAKQQPEVQAEPPAFTSNFTLSNRVKFSVPGQ